MRAALKGRPVGAMQAHWRRGEGARRLLAAPSNLQRDPLRRDRSDGIDVLRALFALWVVLAHLIPWSVFVQGPEAVPWWIARGARLVAAVFQPVGELHPAVLGFIVLSGYCIHRAGLRLPGAGAMTGYGVRRFFRIVPLYYIAIVAGLVGFALAMRQAPTAAAALSGTQGIDLGCIAAKALVLPAFYPGVYACSFLGNAPLATVMVEIVLYLLYAAAFAGLVWRGRERVVWYACGGLFLASLAMLGQGVGGGFYGWWQNGSIFGYLPYWWLGVAFVNPAFSRACAGRLWWIVIAWVALGLVLALTSPPAVLALAELRKLCFALGVGILIVAMDNARLAGLGPLALIGRAGYGLYAIHAPLTYTLAIYGLPWWAVLTTNVLAGLVIHVVIERPLIDLGRLVRGRLAPPALAVPAAR
ncbi:MAG TPA: acyltransferase [Stellaceae bacterium]|nr:acyltransferase [Stellaceae bacterium]